MGGERSSSTRMRCAGKICCECKMPLPPPHRPGERLCARCASGSDKRRVYMEFVFNQGWECRFFEEDLNADKAAGVFHVSLERIGLHYGMVDMRRLASIGNDKAYGRGIKDMLDYIMIFATTAQGPEKSVLSKFLTAAQRRFSKFA